MLIIDDLGPEFVSSYTNTVLFDIINTRIASGKSTVITSNFNFGKIDELYGTRITSRLQGSFEPVMFAGKDLRRA